MIFLWGMTMLLLLLLSLFEVRGSSWAASWIVSSVFRMKNSNTSCCFLVRVLVFARTSRSCMVRLLMK